MKKTGCGCLGIVLVAGVAILALLVLSPIDPTTSTPAPIAPPTHPTAAAEAIPAATPTPAVKLKATPRAADAQPPSLDDLRAAYSEVTPVLKQLDALGKRPAANQYLKVLALQSQFIDAIAMFDSLCKRSPDDVAREIQTVANAMLSWHADTIPTDATPAKAQQTKQAAERAYLALLRSAEQWEAGPGGHQSSTLTTIAQNAVDNKIQSMRLHAIMQTLAAMGLDSSIIESVGLDGNTVTIAVANDWHYQPYVVRLQAAQNLYQLSEQFVPNPRLLLADSNGNRVGGSGTFDPTSIDVLE